jgi:hypothetical protein
MSIDNHTTGRDAPDHQAGPVEHGPARPPSDGGLPGDVADLTPAERELESGLARLRPVVSAAAPEDLLRLAFRAGRSAADADVAHRTSRKLVLWRAAAAVLVGGLGISLLSRPAPQFIDRERIKVVYVERPANAAATAVVARQGDPRAVPDRSAQRPFPTEANAGTHSTLPEFLSPLDSPSRPLIPAADADYLSVRDAVLRLGVRVIPSPRAVAPSAGPVTLETLLGPSAPASREPARRGGVAPGFNEIKKFLTGGQT